MACISSLDRFIENTNKEYTCTGHES